MVHIQVVVGWLILIEFSAKYAHLHSCANILEIRIKNAPASIRRRNNAISTHNHELIHNGAQNPSFIDSITTAIDSPVDEIPMKHKHSESICNILDYEQDE